MEADSMPHVTTNPQRVTRTRMIRGRPPSSGATALPKARLMDYLVASMLLTFVWRIQDLYPILARIRFPFLVSLLAVAVFLLGRNIPRMERRFRHPIFLGVVFTLLWTIPSIPGGVYPGLSLSFVVNTYSKTVLMFVIIVGTIRTFRDAERLVLVQMAGAAIYCVMILTRFRVGADGRLGNLIFYDANGLAMFIVCTLPLAVYFLRSGASRAKRLAAAGSAVVFVVAIAKTGSRGGFLGLLAVGLYLLLGYRAIRWRVRLGALVGVGALLFAVAGPHYWQMMGTLRHPESDYNWAGNSYGGRMDIWERGIGYMMSHPVFGVGANAFPAAEGTISPLASRQAWGYGLKWSAAHNSFIQIGAELGVPGLLSLILLLWFSARTARQISRASPERDGANGAAGPLAEALIGTLIGYAVCGFFLSQAYSAYLYATFGILVGLAAVVNGERGHSALQLSRAAASQHSVPGSRSLRPIRR